MSHFTGGGGNDFMELESGLTEIVSEPTKYTTDSIESFTLHCLNSL